MLLHLCIDHVFEIPRELRLHFLEVLLLDLLYLLLRLQTQISHLLNL